MFDDLCFADRTNDSRTPRDHDYYLSICYDIKILKNKNSYHRSTPPPGFVIELILTKVQGL
jgi:hypothetical protein